MIARCLLYFILFAAFAFLFGVVGTLGAYTLQGESIARGFVHSYFVTFDAIGVTAAGFALLCFVRIVGRTFLAQLLELLDVPEEHAIPLARGMQRARSWAWATWVSIPLTLIGSTVLWWRGFPLSGFAKFYLLFCTSTIYYVASNILAFYLSVIFLFRYVEDRSCGRTQERFKLRHSPGSLEMQTIDRFLVTSATMGVLTLYIGLRATLTADFLDKVPFFRELLLLPFILYLPATICYSLYPRYVLRQIAECETLMSIEEFERQTNVASSADLKTVLELRRLIMDVKEKMLSDCRATPIVGLKDAPSLTMSLVIILQFIAQRDSVISGFLNSLFK